MRGSGWRVNPCFFSLYNSEKELNSVPQYTWLSYYLLVMSLRIRMPWHKHKGLLLLLRPFVADSLPNMLFDDFPIQFLSFTSFFKKGRRHFFIFSS